MEQPGLQELRNACADLSRNDEEDQGFDDDDDEEDQNAGAKPKSRTIFPAYRGSIPRTWTSKREKELNNNRERIMGLDSDGRFIDFGSIDDDGQYKIKKIRAKVCGRYVHNYPSEKAMLRGGWLHFSIIAKASSLFDAMSLCRNWDEFLN